MMMRKTWILLGLLVVVAISATAAEEYETIPKREAFTLPAQMFRYKMYNPPRTIKTPLIFLVIAEKLLTPLDLA